jgi:hypothetical protein
MNLKIEISEIIETMNKSSKKDLIKETFDNYKEGDNLDKMVETLINIQHIQVKNLDFHPTAIKDKTNIDDFAKE